MTARMGAGPISSIAPSGARRRRDAATAQHLVAAVEDGRLARRGRPDGPLDLDPPRPPTTGLIRGQALHARRHGLRAVADAHLAGEDAGGGGAPRPARQGPHPASPALLGPPPAP